MIGHKFLGIFCGHISRSCMRKKGGFVDETITIRSLKLNNMMWAIRCKVAQINVGHAFQDGKVIDI